MRKHVGWMMAVPGGVLWATVVYYHFVRRGVWNPFGEHDLGWFFLSNKGMAITGMLLAGGSVAVGPLARWFPAFRPWAGARRELGLAGFGWIVLHILTNVFFLGARFPWRFYVQRPWSLVAAILSLGLLILIAAVSTTRARRTLGARTWQRIQRLVYPALGLGVLHYLLLGKAANWARWARAPETRLPPGTLVLTVILLGFLVVRLDAIRASARPGDVVR